MVVSDVDSQNTQIVASNQKQSQLQCNPDNQPGGKRYVFSFVEEEAVSWQGKEVE